MPGDVDCLICGCRTLILFCLSVFGFGSFRFECVFVRSVSWLSVLCVCGSAFEDLCVEFEVCELASTGTVWVQ